MSSTLSFDIIRHTDPEGIQRVRSHILHPHSDITVICMVMAEKENVVSVLEDHLLESISSTGWNQSEEEADFTYVTEKYNHFQRNLAEADMRNTGCLFAIVVGDSLMISVIGSMNTTLREKNGDLSMIAENDENSLEFSSVSHGKIPHGSQIFFTSKPISNFVSEDCLDECSRLSHESFIETLEGILQRDTHDTLHIIRLIDTDTTVRKATKSRIPGKKIAHQIDIARGYLTHIRDRFAQNPSMIRSFERIEVFFGDKSTYILISFLFIGGALFFGLMYVLLGTLFTASNNPQSDTKNQIIQAQALIEESQKLTSNSQVFNSNIKKAEAILFKIRDKQEYMKDTQDLLQRIEAMKKEMYDIQTIDLSKRNNIIKFNPIDISPIGVFEYEKKLNLIGKNSTILGYVVGNPLPAASGYPPGEEVRSVDITEDGNFYFLTKNNRVLSTKRNEITYANVTGQESWENATKIRSFNNNIYLLDTLGGQIYKHKPGINGFSQKSEVLTKSLSGILDVGIDGGFYIVTDEPKVYRMISKEGMSQSGIVINKIPGEYTLGGSSDTELVVRQNLNYIYMLSGNRIWIFEPDSRRFQDVHSWSYLAQLEVSTDESIRSISVPRDGLIYIVTNLGVYEIPFDLIDKNIILKN